MKKIFLFLLLISSSFLITNNVKAANQYSVDIRSENIQDINSWLSRDMGSGGDYLTSLEDINSYFLTKYELIKTTFPYYTIYVNAFNSSIYFNVYFFKSLPNIKFYPYTSGDWLNYSFYSDISAYSSYTQYFACGDSNRCKSNINSFFSSIDTVNPVSINANNHLTYRFDTLKQYYNLSNNIYTPKGNYSNGVFILSSNVPQYNLYNSYHSVSVNDYLNYQFLDFAPVSPNSNLSIPTYISSLIREPEISLVMTNHTSSLGNTISKTLDFTLSNFNENTMYFQMKYPNSDNWLTLDVPIDSYSLDIYNNGNYYFRIIDFSDETVLDSLTLVVNDITEFSTPDVNITTEVPDECFVKFNNIDYKVCELLNLEITGSSGNFLNQYKIDNGSWIDINRNNFTQTFTFNNNSTFYFRTVDLNDNSYLNLHTVSITGIDDISSFGSFAIPILKTSIYNYPYLNFLLYNFLENYTFQAKLGKDENFTTLNVDCSSLNTCQADFFQNITGDIVYFRILDNNDNIIFNDIYSLDNFNYGNNIINKFINNLNGDFTSSLSKIVNLPLNYYRYLINSTNICQPLILPLPFFNNNVSLPCVSTIIKNFNNDVYEFIKLCIHGVLSFYLVLQTYNTLKRSISPDDKRKEKDF